MRVLVVHNNYRIQGGEEYLVQSVGDVLRCHGADVVEFRKVHTTGARQAALAFFTGLRNPSVIRELEAVIAKASPSHAFIGNLYPTISPAALGPIRRAGLPIVMNVANRNFKRRLPRVGTVLPVR